VKDLETTKDDMEQGYERQIREINEVNEIKVK